MFKSLMDEMGFPRKADGMIAELIYPFHDLHSLTFLVAATMFVIRIFVPIFVLYNSVSVNLE
jgi:hypothetical protein